MCYSTSLKATTLLGAGLILFPLGAEAQEGNQTLQLPTIVVQGIEESAQRAAELKRSAPNAIEVVDGEQVRQFNERTLGDSLRRLPGVTFDSANRSREVRLRGLPGEYTQVLINGRPLVDGESRRSFEVDRIPSGLVDRIEIVRSPRASQDGSGPAGTINVVLKSDADIPEGTEISVDGGYLEDQGGIGGFTASHAGSVGPLSFNLAASLQQTRRSESKDELEFDGSGNPDGGTLEINERRFEQFNFTPTFALDMGSGGTLTLNPFYFFTEEFRDDIETDLLENQVTVDEVANEAREREREAYGIRAAWDVDLSSQTNLRLSFDWQEGRTDTVRDEVVFDANGAPIETKDKTENIDLERIRPEAVLSTQLGAHDLSFGIGANLQIYDETNAEVKTKAGGTPEPKVKAARVFEIDEDIIFGFVEDVWEPTERLTLTGGLRIEDSSTDTTDISGATNGNDETFLLPSINAVYNLSSQTDLRAGLARTLRRPDLRTLSPTFEDKDGTPSKPDEQGNPDQDPESVWGLDVGVDHYFANNRGFVSANVFYRRFDDKIEALIDERFVPSEGEDRFVASFDNSGDGEAYGIEISGRAPLDNVGLEGVTLWGSGVYTESEVDLSAGGSRQFLNQPDFVGTIGLDYEYRPWKTTFGLAANFTSSVDQTQSLTNGSLRQSIDSRTRLDLSSRTEIADNTFLSISATNLLAETEDRVDRVFDNGSLDSVTRTSEPTYRAFNVRLTKSF